MAHPSMVILLLLFIYGHATLAETIVVKDGKSNVNLLDRFNHRYPDGSYEYRFELDDGTARYERGYFALVNDVKTLMVVGYYSYRMTDGRYITVFYNADQFGYRQNQSITPQVYPNLPRSIDVPLGNEALQEKQNAHSPVSSRYPSQSSSTSTSSSSTASQPPIRVNGFASSTPRATVLPTHRSRF